MSSSYFSFIFCTCIVLASFWAADLSAKQHRSRSSTHFSFNLHVAPPVLAPPPIYREPAPVYRERIIVQSYPRYYSEYIYTPYYQERVVVQSPRMERYYVYPGYGY